MKILIFGKADFDVVQLKESRFAELEVKYRILPLDFLDSNFSINFSLLFSS